MKEQACEPQAEQQEAKSPSVWMQVRLPIIPNPGPVFRELLGIPARKF